MTGAIVSCKPKLAEGIVMLILPQSSINENWIVTTAPAEQAVSSAAVKYKIALSAVILALTSTLLQASVYTAPPALLYQTKKASSHASFSEHTKDVSVGGTVNCGRPLSVVPKYPVAPTSLSHASS